MVALRAFGLVLLAYLLVHTIAWAIISFGHLELMKFWPMGDAYIEEFLRIVMALIFVIISIVVTIFAVNE